METENSHFPAALTHLDAHAHRGWFNLLLGVCVCVCVRTFCCTFSLNLSQAIRKSWNQQGKEKLTFPLIQTHQKHSKQFINFALLSLDLLSSYRRPPSHPLVSPLLLVLGNYL